MSIVDGMNNRASQMRQDPRLSGVTGNENEKGKSDPDSHLFAGNLNLPQAPAEKIGAARKHAMKLVRDAFDIKRSTDSSLNEIREQRGDAESDLAERKERAAKIREGVSKYAEEHGITEDSGEQKDLDLIRKVRDRNGSLSEEEYDRYTKVMERGLTEYQKLALDADSDILNAQVEIDQDKEKIRAYNTAIRDVKLESLKDQSMVKAQKGKDEIMEAASKEVVSSLMQDAVENITEEQEKVREDAEEKAEKQAEEKEKAKKREEERKEREILEGEAELERLSAQDASPDQQAKVNSEIQNILNKLSLLEDDIKGIEVNEQL